MRRNRWPVSGAWEGEEITATFTATGVRDWVGHPDVPGGMNECISIEDVELQSVTICDVNVPLSEISDIIKEIIYNQTDEIEWEDD